MSNVWCVCRLDVICDAGTYMCAEAVAEKEMSILSLYLPVQTWNEHAYAVQNVWRPIFDRLIPKPEKVPILCCRFIGQRDPGLRGGGGWPWDRVLNLTSV